MLRGGPAPGFQGLTDWRARADELDQLYLCTLRSDPEAIKFSDFDDTGSKWVCTSVKDIESVAKTGYYLVRTYQWLIDI